MKKYTNEEAMVIIKNLLNLVVKDKKRFAGLRNKFKQTVEDYKIVDDVVTTVIFSSVEHSIVLKELEEAIISLEKYAERSAKKQKELSDILAGCNIPITEGKPKTIKVTKVDNGKIKKVIKDKPLPKNNEPKEVKKVKNKNEPIKKPTNDKLNLVAPKKKSTKTVKKTETKSKGAIDPLDQQIKDFIETLDGTNLSQLIYDILDAFANDSRLNVTMNNWVSKTSSEKDAAIGMLTSAYKRKPSNSKLKNTWYKKLEESINQKDIKEPKPKQTIKNDSIKEEQEVSNNTNQAESETEDPQINLYIGLLSKKLIDNPIKCSFRLNSVLLNNIYGSETEAQNYYIYCKINESDILPSINEYLDIVSDSDISFEATELEKTTVSKYKRVSIFNQISILNILNMIKSSGGIENSLRKILLGEYYEINIYREKSLNQSQLENYSFNRKIITQILKIGIEQNNKDNILFKLFNLIGEIILNTLGKYFINLDEAVSDNEIEETIKYNITSSEISFIFENTSFIIQKTDSKYNEIYNAVLSNDAEKLKTLVLTDKTLKEEIKDFVKMDEDDSDQVMLDDIKIIDKQIFYKGKIFKGRLSSALIQHIANNNKEQINRFKKFIHNCSLNPSHDSVSELYDFMVLNNLKVTPTGTIILYKWVRENYFDSHTGKFLNKPGHTLYMDRSKVNVNRNQTCSNGLHLCSYKYGSFGARLLLCEVHPKNVVSIPSDCSQSKMRCCEYTVLLDITEYVGEMNNKGDFITMCENLHYNSKILEIEIMKMFPSVVRKNSIYGLNGLNNLSEKDLLKKLFSKNNFTTIEEVKENISPILEEKFENIEITTDNCKNFLEDEMEDSKVEESNEESKVEESNEESKVEESNEESKEESKEEDHRVFITFEKYFQKLKKSDNVSSYKFRIESVDEFLRNPKLYDSIILKKVFMMMNIDFKNYKATTEEEVLAWVLNYFELYNDELSSDHYSREHLENKKDIAEEVKENVDEVKIVERLEPEKEKDGLFNKTKSFFKKLF